MVDPKASNMAVFRTGGFKTEFNLPCSFTATFHATDASRTVVGPGERGRLLCDTDELVCSKSRFSIIARHVGKGLL